LKKRNSYEIEDLKGRESRYPTKGEKNINYIIRINGKIIDI